MARAYAVVLVVTIAACAGLAAMFDFADRHPDQWVIALAVFLIFFGLLMVLSLGPLRRSFERVGLGRRRDRSPIDIALSVGGPVFGISDSGLMRFVLGPKPGFSAMFTWLAVSFAAATATYSLVRRRLARL